LPHFWHIQSFIVNLDTMPLTTTWTQKFIPHTALLECRVGWGHIWETIFYLCSYFENFWKSSSDPLSPLKSSNLHDLAYCVLQHYNGTWILYWKNKPRFFSFSFVNVDIVQNQVCFKKIISVESMMCLSIIIICKSHWTRKAKVSRYEIWASYIENLHIGPYKANLWLTLLLPLFNYGLLCSFLLIKNGFTYYQSERHGDSGEWCDPCWSSSVYRSRDYRVSLKKSDCVL
jgi:hypothetical protein